MARRRPTAPGTKPGKMPSPKRRRYLVEALESRKYLVVLHGGDVFEFWADGNHMERVVVRGNTTVELIGSHVSSQVGLFPGTTPTLFSMDGIITAGPDRGTVGAGLPPEALQGSGGGGGGGGNGNAPTFTDDIYAMYVSQADTSSRIAVAGVPLLNQANRPMQPYTGNVQLLVAPNTGGQNITVSTANSGTALLGARTVAPQNQNGGAGNNNFPANEPIYAPAPFTPGTFPTLPTNMSSIGAGLTVAQGANLGQFLFGGTMLGTVNIHGSVQFFYGGWILTGAAIGNGGIIIEPINFNVDGDIQNLVSNSSIGTNTDSGLTDLGAPTYTSGFNMHVGGKVGMIKTADSFVGTLDVTNSPTAPGLGGLSVQQVDVRTGGGANSSWDNATWGGDTALPDDTFVGAQFLGPINANGDTVVNGQVEGLSATNNKSVDYYAVPLMAGQTITYRLSATFTGMHLGVFDPERRLIFTDDSEVDPLTANGSTYTLTAKLPGVYYFAITDQLNESFANAFTPLLGTEPYTLTVSGLGNMAIGGLVATNNILDFGVVGTSNTGHGAGFHVANGDFGAAFCGGVIISDDVGTTTINTGNISDVFTFVVDNGDLRNVEGASLGNGIGAATSTTNGGVTLTTGFAYTEWPTGLVPNGSVGMLRATSTANATGQAGTGVLLWNIFGLAETTGTGTLVSPEASLIAIGGDYQMVDAANYFEGELVANGNIGTIRANSMASPTPSYFQVNAANDPNKQGTIDVIDVTTQIGINGVGGPAIITGKNGNCRYIHVGPNGSIFRDFVFGGGSPEGTLYQPGETALITDDSGANVSIAPQNAADSLIVTTYPIRGSGGAAIVKVEVTNTTNATAAGGVNITTSGGGTAEIGSIQLDGAGTPVTPGAAGGAGAGGAGGTGGTGTGGTGTGGTTSGSFPPPGSPGGAPVQGPATANSKFTLPTLPNPPTIAPTTPMDVTINGDATADIYEITGITNTTDGSLLAGRGRVTSITNTTGDSEIVNVHLTSLGTLTSSGTVGMALKQHTAAAPTGNFITHKTEDGTTGAPYSYPLYEVSSLVRVTGNIVSLNASKIGNVYAGVIINSGTPNDPVPTANTVPATIPAGGPLAQGANGAVGSIGGSIIGAVVTAGAINSVFANGIGWWGTGTNGAVGIFSTGVIGPVTVNGDDRGVILSTLGQVGITINNGSLLQGLVAFFSRFDYAQPRSNGFITQSVNSPFTRPTLDVGGITVKGSGGILGALIAGQHIGPVSVADGGYGVFDSAFTVVGDGTFAGVSAGGYGLRDVILVGGATASGLLARGDGSQIPITNFPASVRNSEQGVAFDPVTGQTISALNDLDFYLGTSLTNPVVPGSTESGVIEDCAVLGSRDIGTVQAWSIRGRVIPSGNVSLASTGITTVFNVANMVNNIKVTGPVQGFTITTGRTGKYQFVGDVGGFVLSVAGQIGNLVFNSSLLDDSSISAQGPSGRIASILVKGNFSGTISAVRNIGKITIQGSMIGTIHGASLGTLKLTGGLGNGSLLIDTSVGTIQTLGDLGVPGNTLTINGNLDKLQVGGNLNTNVSVGGNLKNLLVAKSILSATNVNVVNTITLLQVGGDVQAGAVIQAHLIKKKVIKGQMLGTITTA